MPGWAAAVTLTPASGEHWASCGADALDPVGQVQRFGTGIPDRPRGRPSEDRLPALLFRVGLGVLGAPWRNRQVVPDGRGYSISRPVRNKVFRRRVMGITVVR